MLAKPLFQPAEPVRELLERLHDKYNTADFVADDPISVPHRFSTQQDIEIAGFLAATIAWGNRKAIVKSALRMVEYMDNAPYDFTVNASDAELDGVLSYVHRTFNGGDFRSFILALRHFYEKFGTMGDFFEAEYQRSSNIRTAISAFRTEFFATDHPPRCEKHLSAIDRGASCKRTNMFLRWMVRHDDRGVDFGLWRGIPMSALYLPLDVHSGNTARSLGLLARRQNDWKAVEEVTASLHAIDPTDPVRFDFALFGAGITGEIYEQ
jgi:uncharacterized protein (TIGR02757 family)